MKARNEPISVSERIRDEEGEFVETITPERALAPMRDADAPVVTASDIADELEHQSAAVTKKLEQLQERDRVARRQVGARAVVRWLVEQPPLDTASEHDPAASFVASAPFDADDGEPIGVADTDEVIGDALADGNPTGEYRCR